MKTPVLTRSWGRPVSAVLVMVWLFAAGCGTESERGTPQKTALAFMEARDAKDWRAACSHFTPEGQEKLALDAVRSLSFVRLSGDDALIESLERLLFIHGWTNEENVSSVEDPGRLFVDLADWMADKLPSEQWGERLPMEGWTNAEFTGFDVEENVASASMAPDGFTMRVDFKRVDGEWYLDP